MPWSSCTRRGKKRGIARVGRMARSAGRALLCAVIACTASRVSGVNRVKEADQLFFGVLSDWGGQTAAPYTTPGQVSAADALAKVALANDLKFVVSAGGNFLESGLPAGLEAEETMDRVTNTFQEVYSAHSLQVPWYITGSINDWEGNLTAEMALNGTEATGGRWTYPDLWHTFTTSLPPFGETVQIVLIDTETLTGNNNYRPPWMGSALYYPPGPASGRRSLQDFNVKTSPPVSNEQWEWVGKTLNTSEADWLIVVGNSPVWSAGEYGPTWQLEARLAPLMEANAVSLYISGRDPIMQHLKSVPSGTVDYVVIGNGAYFNSTMAEELPNLEWCPYEALQFGYGESTGFLSVQITSATLKSTGMMTVTFYDDNGNALYSFTKGPTRAQALSKGGGASAKSAIGTLVIFGGLFLIIAVGLCLFGASAHAKATSDSAPGFTDRPPRVVIPKMRGVTEVTPLRNGRGNSEHHLANL